MLGSDDVRRIAMALPGTTLDPKWGQMTFKRRRTYAVLRKDGSVLLRLSISDQAALVGERPDIFTPFAGRGPKGVTAARVDQIDHKTLEFALRAAWGNAAPVEDTMHANRT